MEDLSPWVVEYRFHYTWRGKRIPSDKMKLWHTCPQAQARIEVIESWKAPLEYRCSRCRKKAPKEMIDVAILAGVEFRKGGPVELL